MPAFPFRPAAAGLMLAAALLAACGGADGERPAAAAAAAPPTLLIAPEDMLVLRASSLAQGPLVTGSVQPGKRADLRAEVAAVVVEVLRDNGESVRAGELLMRLDDTAIRDSLNSAREAERAASQALEQAQRTVERLQTLQAQGMISMQGLEDAELRRNAAQSERVAAQARLVSARQQLAHTRVTAPFAGVVSERRASVGDTVLVGRELVKVIDPRSMRFEGLVSADRLSEIALGQPVAFRINGFGDQAFGGSVQRIDAAVNAATRQVGLIVAFDEPAAAPRVAGLFAEGRVETGSVEVIAVPDVAVRYVGEQATVWRVGDGRIEQVDVRVAERNARSGELPVLEGLAAGDRILRAPTSNLTDGQPIELAVTASAAAASAAAVK